MDKSNTSDFDEIFKVLKDANVVFKDINKAAKSLEKAVKLDKTLLGSSSFFTAIPFIAEKLGYKGAMIAHIKAGTHLAKKDGMFLGTQLSDLTNSLDGQARFSMASPKGADIISIVFTALAFITGQYYMNELDKDYGKTNGKLTTIINNLEADKDAELRSGFTYLQETMDSYSYIMFDDRRVQATINQLNSMLLSTDKVIESSKSLLGKSVEELSKDTKEGDPFATRFDNVFVNAKRLRLAVLNYGTAKMMEMLFSDVVKEDELGVQRERINQRFLEADEVIEKALVDLKSFIGSDEFATIIKNEQKSVPKQVATHLLVPVPFNFVVSKAVKDSQKDKAGFDYLEKYYQNLEEIKKLRESTIPTKPFDEYKALLDKDIEVTYVDGEYYIDLLNKGVKGE